MSLNLTTTPLGSILFNGSNWVSSPGNSNFTLGTADFTMECWFRTTTNPGLGQIIGFRSSANGGFGAVSMFVSSTNLVTYCSSNAGGWDIANGTVISAISLNTWYHLAAVRNGSSLVFYLNGTASLTISLTSFSSAFTQTANALFLGGDDLASPGDPYTGYISSVRFVRGLAVYTANFTPPTAPLTAAQSAGVNISAITTVQTTWLLQTPANTAYLGDSSIFAYTASQLAGAVASSLTPFTSNVVSNSFLTMTNNPLGSVSFNGSSQYLTAPVGASTFGTGDFTVECWIYKTSATSCTVACNATGNSDNNYWYLGTNANGTIAFGIRDSAAAAVAVTGSITTSINTWVHAAAVRVSGTVRLFVNGALDNSGTITKAVTARTTNIGSFQYTGFIDYFPGYISNFRIVNGVAVYTGNFVPPTQPLSGVQAAGSSFTNIAAITGAQTSLLLQTPSNGNFITDSSVNNFTLTNNGTATASSLSPFSAVTPSVYQGPALGSLTFSGTTSTYMNTTSSTAVCPGAGDFTIEMWIKITTVATTQRIAGCVNVTGTDLYWALDTNTGLFEFGGWTTTSTLTSAATLPLVGQWGHVAWVRIAGTETVYINGRAGTLSAGGTSLTRNPTTSSSSLTIGTGTQSLTVGTGLTPYTTVGTPIIIAFNSTNYMAGTIASYTTGTGALTVTVTSTVGSGTYTSWSVNLPTNFAGAAGTGAATLYIGVVGAGATNLPWGGQLSNFRMVKGVGVYTGNFTVPVTPLASSQPAGAAGSNIAAITATQTSVLLNTPNAASYLADSSSNNFVFTVSGATATQSAISPFLTSNGPVAMSYTPTPPGSALFSGYNSSLTQSRLSTPGVPLNGPLDLATGAPNWTIECWYYATAGTYSLNGLFGLNQSYTMYFVSGTLSWSLGTGSSFTQTKNLPVNLQTGAWNHIALVRNSTVITTYLNGVLQDTTTLTITMGTSGSGLPLYIGNYADGSVAFPGFISNFRIVKGIAVYTGNFTVPTAPLAVTQTSSANIAAITNSTSTSLLLPTPNTGDFVDNSVYNFTLTNTGSAPSTALSPFTASAISMRYLVVGGGGAGGSGSGSGGGGGGGGGMLDGTGTFSIVPGTTYLVTVGTGGSAIAIGNIGNAASQGGNSSVAVGSVVLLSAAGGGYNPASNQAGGSGGSGAGAGGSPSQAGGAGNIPTYSPQQGATGGPSPVGTFNGGGGGGGGGSNGVNGSTGITNGSGGGGGAGGTGNISTIITTSQATTLGVGQVSAGNVYFAGGGGGGGVGNIVTAAGGTGGGGTGGGATSGSGTNGTGGGGGGATGLQTSNSGRGGNGVVILKFATSGTLPTSTTGATVLSEVGNVIYSWTSNGTISF